jgi:hypothetical protein
MTNNHCHTVFNWVLGFMYSVFFLLRIRATPGLMNAEYGRIQPFGLD